MAKNAAAKAKSDEVKAAEKKIKAKGVQPYKHEPKAPDPDAEQTGDFDPAQSPRPNQLASMQDPTNSTQGKSPWPAYRKPGEEGVDSVGSAVVQSGRSSSSTTTGDSDMNAPTTALPTKTKQEVDAAAAQAKIAEKAEKKAAAEKAKAEKEKAAAEKKAAAQAERQKKIDERDALMAQRKKEREEAIAKAAAEGKTPRERTYEGSMLALSERVKQGVYVKGTNGQLRSTDEVALALDGVPAKKVVPLLMEVFKLDANPYPQLNYGQQSMNLRNRLRGALRKGMEVGEGEAKVKVTIDYVKQLRDDGGYATAEAEAAEKAAAKAKVPATQGNTGTEAAPAAA